MQQCKSVTLRKRQKKNGLYSWFLEFYPGYRDQETMQLLRRKSLGIYTYSKPKNEMEKQFNARMLQKAEAMRCRVYEEVVNERFEFFSQNKMKGDFLAYYEGLLARKNQKWVYVYRHFEKFVGGSCTFEEVTVDLCRKFQDYLLTADKLNGQGKVGINSIAGYWSTFRGMLNIAYRDHKIKDNVNDYLERINYEPTMKQSLSLAELRTLSATPCDIDILKRAALFSCLTGMRRSDIINMKWDNVRSYADGGWYVEFLSVKTKANNIIPISKQAYDLLPERTESPTVFVGFKREMTSGPMQKWLKAAGIKKHITFHCFRHTFASLQIEMGTDVYTVQELLAHKNVSTTQIYARHAEGKKREAAEKILLTDVNPTSGNE